MHQIELEIQNQELRHAWAVAEVAADNYTKLFDFAPSGYFTLSREGKIIDLNLAASRMLGKERSLLKNCRFGFFIPVNIRPVFNEFLENAFVSGLTGTCEVNLGIENSSPVYVFLTGLADEKREKCQVNMVDITDFKLIERELIAAKAKAEEGNRLKTAFLENMSHEIRTPMNGILGFAELLKEPKLTGEEQKEYIQVIEKSGARMLTILQNISDISMIESGQMGVTLSNSNINEHIEYIFNYFKQEAEGKGLQMIFHNGLPDEESVISTDARKLDSILAGLVRNSVTYTRTGRVELGYERKGKALEFYVKDTGMGIPRHLHEEIFKRFAQADISHRQILHGAGLGLSVAKAFVEMLGGKIHVESEEGKGSEFSFSLPYHCDPGAKEIRINENSAPGIAHHDNKLKILIAEDDEDSDYLISTILAKKGIELLHTESGLQTIELCRNNPDIDIILMDIRMPDLSGYEATRRIRGFNKEVAIIAQTAYSLKGDREKAIEAGCDDYISKPIDKAELLSLVYRYGNKQVNSNSKKEPDPI